jgi:hypothetical protein
MLRELKAVVCAAILASPAIALAEPPDPAAVRRAADHFDEGARAFKKGDFEEAASQFEAADALVPSADALRLATRARQKAGQPARAATLAALVQERHPDDEQAQAAASEVMAESEAGLHRVEVSCASPCVLAVGTRTIHGASNTRWVIYLEPGDHELGASFFGDAGNDRERVQASAGGQSELRFEPGEEVTPPPPPPSDGAASPPPDEGGDATGQVTLPDPSSGLHPAFFFIGLAATAGAGGVTIWSAVDTQNNPGQDAVREACAGQGEDCPEYQDGVSRQNRTNILIGATAGAAALTVVLAILTDWDGSPTPGDESAVWLTPSVGHDHRGVPHLGGVGVEGRF